MTKLIRPLRSGQITIPVEFRRELGITDDSLLQLSVEKGELRLKPVSVTENNKGSLWLKELYEQFAPVREETQSYSLKEIDSAITQAVKAVRKHHD
jgi:bifunctional DNA-binding transcriptional regulator/antitoxin component of YhaV-PrlF toxin-antitoxin module